MQCERRDFFDVWEPPEITNSIIGKGKYGVVYASADGGTALKQVKLRQTIKNKKTAASLARMTRQLARECLVFEGLTVMALRGACTHYPLMYSIVRDFSDSILTVNIFMEKFEGSLASNPGSLLQSEHDWLSMLHQVSTAVWSASRAFQLSHCDLYPKNVLFRRVPPQRLAYKTYHEVITPLTIFYAVTDYGVCASPCFDATDKPEVCHSLPIEVTASLSELRTTKHILCYDVPANVRDYYMLLSWVKRPADFGLPPSPEGLVEAAQDCLQRLQNVKSADDVDSILRFFFKGMRTEEGSREIGADVGKVAVARTEFEILTQHSTV